MEEALTETATLLATVAATVRPDQLDAPTPCSEFSVAELLDHVGEELQDSEQAARKVPRTKEYPSFDGLALARAAELAAAAWQRDGALDGTTDFGPGEMPAELAAVITVHELALHGWDLARATGQDFPLSEATEQAVLAAIVRIGEQARANGAYGPALDVPADASAFERALAASGRDARWKPEA